MTPGGGDDDIDGDLSDDDSETEEAAYTMVYILLIYCITSGKCPLGPY